MQKNYLDRGMTPRIVVGISVLLMILSLIGNAAGATPVAYWKFNENSGTTASDSSGNSNTGTVSGASWTPGIVGNALRFDGVNDYVDAGNGASLNLNNRITITAWIKSGNTWGPSSFPRILDKMGYEHSGYAFMVDKANNRLELSLPTLDFYSNNDVLTLNKWQHVAVSFDGSNIRFYVNGVSAGTSANTELPTANSLDLIIGDMSGYTGTRSFKGLIDEVKIYNSALSASEIQSDYNAGQVAIAYWKLDENAGTTAFDSSGNGNTGTISGAAWTTGKVGYALSFDGINDYINAGNRPSLNPDSQITILAWIKSGNTWGPSSFPRILDKMGYEHSGYAFMVDKANNRLELSLPNDDLYSNSNVLALNRWQRVAVSFDGSNVRFYVNGVSAGTRASTDLPTANNLNLIIGDMSGYIGTRSFKGSIDDLRIYNRALSASEILADYNAGVVSPNGGETWIRGTANTISWNPSVILGANVRIELLKNGISVRTLTASTPNDGSYRWTISSSIALGYDYKIKVTSTTNPVYTDTSDKNFIIGGINVISPNGGENWARGTQHTVRWSSLGDPGPYVRIQLLKNNALAGTIYSATRNDGSQSWTISPLIVPGIDYKVRIMSTSNNAYKDTSNNNFIIS